MSTGPSRVVCPNGHPAEPVQTLPCNAEGCMAYVTYEPLAVGLALARQLEHAVGVLERLANPKHRPRTEEAALLQGEVVEMAKAELNRLGIAPSSS